MLELTPMLRADGVTIGINGKNVNSHETTALMLNKINELVDNLANTETVTAGVVSTAVYKTELSVTGTQAYTIAAPTVAGQRKRIECRVAATVPAGTLTITSPDTTAGSVCSATFFFDAVGQAAEFEATIGLKWRCTKAQRCGSGTLVVGTTVSTGKNLWAQYLLSVTATVASTIAASQGIPDGNTPGERCQVGCSVAAATPVGSIQMTGILPIGGAPATRTLASFGATTNYMNFTWNGAGWLKDAEGVTVTYA